MCVCVYIYVCVYICVCIYICTYVYIYVCMFVFAVCLLTLHDGFFAIMKLFLLKIYVVIFIENKKPSGFSSIVRKAIFHSTWYT